MTKKGLILIFKILLLCTLLTSCEDSNQVNVPESETVQGIVFPIFEWTDKHENSDDWDQYTYDGILSQGQDLIQTTPTDIEAFCTNYDFLDNTEKTFFWIQFVAAMTRLESFFDPSVEFEEGFTDSTGQFVISRGLLQLSYESSRGYRCPVKTVADLHDSKINLQCSVKILNQWIGRDGVITGKVNNSWKGGARYWNVLRVNSKIRQIKQITNNFPLCKN